MPTAPPSRIRQSASLAERERRRTAFSWTLTIIMLAIYFAFIFLVAFDRALMSMQISGVITLGFPIGLLVIGSAIVLTGIYVVRANTQFDRLTERVRGDIQAAAMSGSVR